MCLFIELPFAVKLYFAILLSFPQFLDVLAITVNCHLSTVNYHISVFSVLSVWPNGYR